MKELIKQSKIDNSISFLGFQDTKSPVRSFYLARKLFLDITSIIWITKKAKYDEILHEMYNPKTAILIWKN